MNEELKNKIKYIQKNELLNNDQIVENLTKQGYKKEDIQYILENLETNTHNDVGDLPMGFFGTIILSLISFIFFKLFFSDFSFVEYLFYIYYYFWFWLIIATVFLYLYLNYFGRRFFAIGIILGIIILAFFSAVGILLLLFRQSGAI